VGFSAFHEGRGAGKTDPQGGHILVNRKKKLAKNNSYRKRKVTRKEIFEKKMVSGSDAIPRLTFP